MTRHILSTLILTFAAAASLWAQSPRAVAEIRYVAQYGSYSNDGKSWATAKRQVQDAINDLYSNGLQGEVWVAQGSYSPTESTESEGGSTLYMSFKVYPGIIVRGGFYGLGNGPVEGQAYTKITSTRNADNTIKTYTVKRNGAESTTASNDVTTAIQYEGEATPEDRIKVAMLPTGATDPGEVTDSTYLYETTLTGDLAQKAGFKWNDTKQFWDASFYGNSYHVVWFATAGFDDNGRAKALTSSRGDATVEGFTICNGNARNTDLGTRYHTAYGGGAYMVKGSRLRDCRILNCEASRDGGGIYMDGGGVVEHCYIANCQALGIGVENGYGGGICIDANSGLYNSADATADRFGIYRSSVIGNVGRLGGGMAFKYEQPVTGVPSAGTIPHEYQGFASAVLVANNTATTEGGGIYTLNGGAMTNMTVVRNRCNGTGVIAGGIVTGRAGGLYCRNHALVLNSVMWGNTCESNYDVQYASSKSSPDVRSVSMQYCAVSVSDYIDWSTTASTHVFSIMNYNNGTDYKAATGTDPRNDEVFPNFRRPSFRAGWYDGADVLENSCWTPDANGCLANAGIVSYDLNRNGTFPFIAESTDILRHNYTSHSTLGAYTRIFLPMTATNQVDGNGDGTPETTTGEWHFYVDPNAATYRISQQHGISWESPARYLANVLYTIKNKKLPNSGVNYETDEFVIHVKEGSTDNTNSYSSERVRNVSLELPSNTTIRGGYPAGLEGLQLQSADGTLERNPILYPTFIRGDLMDDYELNASHLFTAREVHDVTIDGLQIRNANARSTMLDNTNTYGAAMDIHGCTDIKVRNCVIAGCTAMRGPAAYITNSKDVEFVNCILHNNEAGTKATAEEERFLSGAIYIGADIANTDNSYTTTFRHCNIMNNVGYGIALHNHAGLHIENSMVFGNMRLPWDKVYYTADGERDLFGTFLTGYLYRTAESLASDASLSGGSRLSIGDGFLYDDFTTIGGTTGVLSYKLNEPNHYPRFVNGVVNAGVSPAGDMTFYGRGTSFMPHNENPMTNAAKAYDPIGTDMSAVITRNYGGRPDVGAIENHASQHEDEGENAYPGGQHAVGEIIYVKEDGDDTNDGLSWDKPLATVQVAIEKAANSTYSTGKPEWIIVTNSTSAPAVIQSCVILETEDIEDDNALFVDDGVIESETSSTPTTETTTNPNTGVITETTTKTITRVETRSYFQIQSNSNETNHWNVDGIATNTNVAGSNIENVKVGDAAVTSVLFSFSGTAGSCRIKTFDGRYLERNGNYLRTTNEAGADNFAIDDNGSTFRFSTSVTSTEWWGGTTTTTYYVRANANDATAIRMQSGSTTNAVNYWKVKRVKVRAISRITTTTTTTKTPEIVERRPQVWVAEGTYTKMSDEETHPLHEILPRVNDQKYSILLREGVNVYGGFPQTGSPGFEDRNPRKYETIVQPGDPLRNVTSQTKIALEARGITGKYPLEYRAHSEVCGSYGRVVVQEKDFTKETVFDGFTITNGYLNTMSRVNISAMFFNVYNNYSNVGLTGGAGVYLLGNGVLENCIIRGNMTYANPETANDNEAAATAESNNRTYVAYSSGTGACHTVAAGVFNKGGIVKNCQIYDNIILFELERLGSSSNGVSYPDAAGLYGAGLFQENGTVYNTIIHDNILKITNMKGENSSFTNHDGLKWGGSKIGYDDPYSTNGKSYNEFWPASNTTPNTSTTNDNVYAAGAGVFLVKGNFYNNTVTHNTYRMWPTYHPGITTIGIGGVYTFNDAKLYNCIIANNEPASFREAGLENPYKTGDNSNDFLGNRSSNDYFNFPILCFNSSGSSYAYNDDQLTVHFSAVDYKTATEAWKYDNGTVVTFDHPIRNQCLCNQIVNRNDSTAYFFNTHNSYGYSAANQEGNTSGDSYTAATLVNASGTNWYGHKGGTASATLLDATFHLTNSSPAMNNGTNTFGTESVTLPDVDADYTERIKDCTVDMGAYEFDDSYAITPRTIKLADGVTVDYEKPATFYVTPEGRGLASANDPSNAACAAKLQRVLDAAGRYKYQHPTQQVIVKVATYANGTKFPYYATRTTDETDMDMRVWSIIVPRGVEVWGGYTDAYTNADDNGFYKLEGGTPTDRRNITANQTQFDSYYYSSDYKTGVTAYHVVTFTDRVFDGDGKPYASTDNDLTRPSTWSTTNSNYKLMGIHGGVTDRAVIDGIFITGGNANLQVSQGSGQENINRYGGAAIVTDYAHVRNCIVRDNKGIYGGALALTHNALVTGCLIDRNQADYGGAIYVFEHGTRLSNGINVDTDNTDKYDETSQDDDKRYDYKMPRVLSTTIVNNEAIRQGGGVWFTDNVRFHSVAIWQNRCQDQANVSGQFSLTRQDDDDYYTTEYYPFNYSAIQGIRPSGLNNVSLHNENRFGARFYSTTREAADGHTLAERNDGLDDPYQFDDFGYFLPADYSMLTRGGMPMENYEKYRLAKDIAEKDFMGVERSVSSDGQRRFLEIGALASNKLFTDKGLMLRLFVAQPDDVDAEAALAMAMAGEAADADDYDKYYSQEGSSFAYPFNRLQDALDYIYRMRGYNLSTKRFDHAAIKSDANNMPFEIWMGRGTYIPSIDITRNNKHAVGNTFLVPEGVSIVGGFDPAYACDAAGLNDNDDGKRVNKDNDGGGILEDNITHFFGAYNGPDFDKVKESRTPYYIDLNTKVLADAYHDIASDGRTYRIHHVPKTTAHATRDMADINANSVIEPWEMAQQTILSGYMEGAENKGVNHIVTIIPNQEYQGALPKTQTGLATAAQAAASSGYMPQETGQIIAFDGITFTGGYAYGYRKGTVDDDHKLKFNHGGAIFVDGNRYNNHYNHVQQGGTVDEMFTKSTYMHARQIVSTGYREIPLMLNSCKFENNHAGYGGAISTNTTLDAMNCSFEHNQAMAGEDVVDVTVTPKGQSTPVTKDFNVVYPGVGGAIYSTYQVTGVNTLFVNNEATDPDATSGTSQHVKDYTILSELIYEVESDDNEILYHKMYTASGGAVFVPSHGFFHFLNCNFVRNQAFAFPAIFTNNPNYQAQMERTATGEISLKDYNQVFNSVFWGNDINPMIKSGHDGAHLEIINHIVNYGEANRGDGGTVASYDISVENAPAADEIDREEDEGALRGYTEQVWFSAYEKGRGKTPNNNLDLRNFVFTPRIHVKRQLITELNRVLGKTEDAYQNCNVELDSENYTSEGPNFVNPSQRAGYAGYTESADWSPARLCNLTDNGWGKITQTIGGDATGYTTDYKTYTASDLPDYPKDRVGTNNPYSAEAEGTFIIDGAYGAIRYMFGNEKYQMTMPIGDQEYMYSNYVDNQLPLYRISMDPNPTHDQTYIDIGVYEYHHTQLRPFEEADAVDVLWVSPIEKPENGLPDGSDWSQPTSDLQRAIETLLSSRNDHRKEIRLMDGTYTPTYTIENKLAFYIDTEKLNSSAMLESDDDDAVGKGVKSLTIKGGYSRELQNVRNSDQYPAVVRQQMRTDGGESDRWDYLFYINDATQRYGVKGDYIEENGFGHTAGNDGDYKGVYTIPIEFDGVRLINDQAKAGVQGSAIYYAPLNKILKDAESYFTVPSGGVTSTPANVSVSVTEGTNVQGTIIVTDHNYAEVPSPAKLIVSKSHIMGSGQKDDTGGEASAVYLGDSHGYGILYNNVLHSNYGHPLDAACRAVTVNNTFALNNGYVRLTGAGSCIHNSVLWRNNKQADETYGIQFELAGFEHPTSAATYPTDTLNLLSYNAYTNGPTEELSYAPGGEVDKCNYNVSLTNDNDDVLGGPNFVDPENKDIELRDFRFSPSLRLMNKGQNANYDTLQVVDRTAAVGELKDFDPNATLYDLGIQTTYAEDAASQPRIVGAIDLGAYEYQNELRRVFFVNPLREQAGTGESWENPISRGGIQDAINLAALYHADKPLEQAFVFVKGAMMRDKEFHTGETLTLLDGVTVFGSIDQNLTDMPVQAAGENYYTDQSLQDYLLLLDKKSEGLVGPNTFRTAINGINTNPHTRYNTNPGIRQMDASAEPKFNILFPITSQIAGFHVTNKNAVTGPVINIDPQYDVDGSNKPKVAMQSIAVYDNKMADGVSDEVKTLAYVRNALVYNSLFRDNDAKTLSGGTARSVMQLDEGAWALNISAQGKVESKVGDSYVSPYNGHGTAMPGLDNEKKNRIVYSVVNYDGQDTDAGKADTEQTKYTMSGHNYRRSDRNMYFQLAEGSKHINEIPLTLTADKPRGCEDFLPANLQSFVHYRIDRDMMGNPRLLSLLPKEKIARAYGKTDYEEGMNLLDRGCFETWFINDKMVKTSTGMPNECHYTPRNQHFAPHTGSVVYINEGCNLVCGTELQPGFLLLRSGASLYGNGQNVKVSYLAVEREIDPRGSVVSLPFPMDYSAVKEEDGTYVTGIARVYYEDAAGNVTGNAEKGGILHLDYDAGTKVYEYDSEERMKPEYGFSATDGAWRELTAGNTQKGMNRGVLIVPPADVMTTNANVYAPDGDGNMDNKLIYSFTARGLEWEDMMYEEEADEKFKTVTLELYDDTESTNQGADFTSQEDMGWNCIGIPYLVSDYRTFNEADATEGIGSNAYARKAGAPASHYNMHIPHTLWLYYNGQTASDGTTAVDGNGGFYSVPSWENTMENSWHLSAGETPRLWVGEGIFVQTASVTGSEELTFYRPLYDLKTGTPKSVNRRYHVNGNDNTGVAIPLSIFVKNRTVYVRGLQGGEQIGIYDVPGRCHQMATVREGRNEWSHAVSQPGIYVVTVNGVGRKVVVK